MVANLRKGDGVDASRLVVTLDKDEDVDEDAGTTGRFETVPGLRGSGGGEKGSKGEGVMI